MLLVRVVAWDCAYYLGEHTGSQSDPDDSGGSDGGNRAGAEQGRCGRRSLCLDLPYGSIPEHHHRHGQKRRLAVYDLAGHTLQYLPDGRLNNVDIRVGFHRVASLWILSQQAIGAVNRDPIVAQLSKLAITQASCSNQDRILGYR